MAAMLDKAVVAMYVRNQCTLYKREGGPETRVPKDDLYGDFLEWAERNGRPCPNMTPAAFGHYLKAAAPLVAPKRCRTKKADHTSRAWFYTRISINEY